MWARPIVPYGCVEARYRRALKQTTGMLAYGFPFSICVAEQHSCQHLLCACDAAAVYTEHPEP